MQKTQDRESQLKKSSYKVALQLFSIFTLTAFLGAIIGRVIDNSFDIEPKGSMFSLIGMYVLSWSLIIKFKLYSTNIKNLDITDKR